MEEALRIALNLEALDRSREAEMRAMEHRMEPMKEPKKRKEKYAKLATKSAKEAIDESSAVQAVPSFA